MSDFVSGIAAKFSFSVTWIFAAAIAIGSGAVFLLPTAARLGIAAPIVELNAAAAVLYFSLAAATTGVAMGILATPLYEVLEGYRIWPGFLQVWGIQRHRRKCQALKRKLRRAKSDLEEETARERLRYYPVDQGQVAPTRFGNCMRALETYGSDRYELDCLTLWSELYSVLPKALQDEVAGSRVGIDFFVATFYLTTVYGLCALVLAAFEYLGHGHIDLILILIGVGTLLVGPIVSYYGAISATRYHASAVQAMVNVGRPQLAAAFGLTMPGTFVQEQEMWDLLTAFVSKRRDDVIATRLDVYRARPPAQTGVASLRRSGRRPFLEDGPVGRAVPWSPLWRAVLAVIVVLIVAVTAILVATLLSQQ